ncbi:MAG: Ni/Co efflux regulator RcnB [Colwellia sp.]|jgi:Ni/Co efflux regulator RcnB
MPMSKLIIIIFFFIFSNLSIAGSKCQMEWNALKNVQTQLRHQSTQRLRDKEHSKHSEYQECRKGNKNQHSKTRRYSDSDKAKLSQNKKPIKYKKYSSTISKVNVKGLFTGKKQQAWLDYYRPNKECKRPKTTQKFSKCLQKTDLETKKFEKLWAENNAPPSIVLGVD